MGRALDDIADFVNVSVYIKLKVQRRAISEFTSSAGYCENLRMPQKGFDGPQKRWPL